MFVCCRLLTVGGHEETGVDLLGVTEVRLDLLPAGIELSLMDPARFDVEHVETDLTVTGEEKKQSLVCQKFKKHFGLQTDMFIF